MIEQTL